MPTLTPQSPSTSFVLTFQGIDFRLDPQQIGSSISFQHAKNDQVLLSLTNFTGVLQVTPSFTPSPTTTAVTTTIDAVSPSSNHVGRVSLSPEQVGTERLPKRQNTKGSSSRGPSTGKVTQSLTKKSNNNKEDHGTKKRRVDQDTDKSPAIIEESTKKSRSELRKLTQDDDEEVSSSHHHPKDMFDKDDSDNSHVAANNDAAREEESIPRPELPVVQEQPHHVLTDSKVPVAPVSMINAPPPRWGHTMTSIDDGSKLLVYGGQTLNEAGVPTTHGDLYVYDIHRSDFSKPIHCEGVERQWHSTVYLAQRQLLIAFGGEAPDRNNKGKITTLNQVMVLDTEIMLWYPPTVSGEIPSGRSGHTASILSDQLMVVFGGVKANKYQRVVSVLDTNRWKWMASPKILGDAPRPRSYHSATTIHHMDKKKDWIVIFGGNDHDSCFNTVHVLEVNGERWSWINPIVSGDLPCPRTGHVATLMDDGTTIFVHGGWDPNSEDDEEVIFDDSFLLDTTTWVWTKADTKFSAGPRVGHRAVQYKDSIHMFGGRLEGGKFSNDLLTLHG